MSMLRALAATWLTDRPHEGVREPYERLLDVRDALHLSSGRTLDRLLLGEIAEVAGPTGLRRIPTICTARSAWPPAGSGMPST